ncbi:MAG: ABC transporter ATP-binding protein [Zoogloeaceae bacterium]|jgi:zinc/manganese transport system ATP-binding protein|nr:ABC transporter ATP-binding protein [Zoogloeaceae bacterium]
MIRLEGLTLGYNRNPAVRHLSLAIAPGELIAVAGPNGAGKSTLLKALAGVLPPIAGTFSCAAPVAFLPQKTTLDTDFPISVLEFTAFGLWRELGIFRGLRAAQKMAIQQALAAVGMSDFITRPVNTLSGGQLQRVHFARLMLQNAPVMLLDEPFSALDQATKEALLHMLGDWHAAGRTLLVALHDLEDIRRHFPRCLLLGRELIAFGETAAVLTETNLIRARHMAEAPAATSRNSHHVDARAGKGAYGLA